MIPSATTIAADSRGVPSFPHVPARARGTGARAWGHLALTKADGNCLWWDQLVSGRQYSWQFHADNGFQSPRTGRIARRRLPTDRQLSNGHCDSIAGSRGTGQAMPAKYLSQIWASCVWLLPVMRRNDAPRGVVRHRMMALRPPLHARRDRLDNHLAGSPTAALQSEWEITDCQPQKRSRNETACCN